jgi:hypothetical protein
MSGPGKYNALRHLPGVKKVEKYKQTKELILAQDTLSRTDWDQVIELGICVSLAIRWLSESLASARPLAPSALSPKRLPLFDRNDSFYHSSLEDSIEKYLQYERTRRANPNNILEALKIILREHSLSMENVGNILADFHDSRDILKVTTVTNLYSSPSGAYLIIANLRENLNRGHALSLVISDNDYRFFDPNIGEYQIPKGRSYFEFFDTYQELLGDQAYGKSQYFRVAESRSI